MTSNFYFFEVYEKVLSISFDKSDVKPTEKMIPYSAELELKTGKLDFI